MKHFSILKKDGQLRLSLSKAWFYYASAVSALPILISLVVILGFIYLYSPLNRVQWIAMVGCAVVAVLLVGLGIVMLILGARKVYTFDRITDRVLRKESLICRAGEIDHVQIDQRTNRSDGQVCFDLSFALKDGRRYQLYGQNSPGNELLELADTVATYLGVRVAKPEGK